MIDVILPVLDEVAALPTVLASLPAGYRPIVVDNGSSDGSGPTAARLGATVVAEPRRGFGAACWSGLLAASTDVVCFMDCDGSLSGQDLPSVCDPVSTGRADMVLGRRRAARGAWPLHARAANHLLAHAVSRHHGVRLHDLGPMRAARRAGLISLDLVDRRFGWPLEMLVKAAQAGWVLEEVDVAYRPRVGRSKVTGTLMGSLRTARDMHRYLR